MQVIVFVTLVAQAFVLFYVGGRGSFILAVVSGSLAGAVAYPYTPPFHRREVES